MNIYKTYNTNGGFSGVYYGGFEVCFAFVQNKLKPLAAILLLTIPGYIIYPRFSPVWLGPALVYWSTYLTKHYIDKYLCTFFQHPCAELSRPTIGHSPPVETLSICLWVRVNKCQSPIWSTHWQTGLCFVRFSHCTIVQSTVPYLSTTMGQCYCVILPKHSF